MPMRRLKNTPPFGDEHVPASFKRKKTRRWCKGRRGIEHVWEWRDWLDFGLVCRCRKDCPDHRIVYLIEVCKTCGRHGDMKTEKRPPACDHDWVEHYWCTFGPNRWYLTICSKCDKRGAMRSERRTD